MEPKNPTIFSNYWDINISSIISIIGFQLSLFNDEYDEKQFKHANNHPSSNITRIDASKDKKSLTETLSGVKYLCKFKRKFACGLPTIVLDVIVKL